MARGGSCVVFRSYAAHLIQCKVVVPLHSDSAKGRNPCSRHSTFSHLGSHTGLIPPNVSTTSCTDQPTMIARQLQEFPRFTYSSCDTLVNFWAQLTFNNRVFDRVCRLRDVNLRRWRAASIASPRSHLPLIAVLDLERSQGVCAKSCSPRHNLSRHPVWA